MSLGIVSASDNTTSDSSLEISANVAGNTFEDIQKVVDSAAENDTIELNGVYKGSGKEIKINKNIIIKGNNKTTLDAQSKSRIFNINAQKVTFLNLNIINAKTKTDGGAIFSNGEVVLINSTFKNNVIVAPDIKLDGSSNKNSNVHGGAIFADKLTIENSSFISNSATCNEIYYEDSVYAINVACGGAIYSKSSLTVINSIFDNNKAGEGCVIYINGKAKILDCVFKNNNVKNVFAIEAASEKDTVEICNSNFTSNSDGISTVGNLVVDKCNFKNNLGYVIYSEYYGENLIQINVSNSDFSNNRVDTEGIISVSVPCSVINSSFTNNRANRGGAIYSVDELYISNCKFISNYASQDGGAIKCRNANIYSSVFEKNKISDYYPEFSGGAIYADGNCNVYDSNFTKNYANFGGGIFTTPFSSSAKLSLTNCNFVDNSQGAIVSHGSKIAIKNKSFSKSYDGNKVLDNNFNQITLINAKTTKLSTTYKSGKTLTVTLKYHDGKPVKRFFVKLMAVKGKTKKYLYAQTNVNGIAKFKVSNLPKGSYKVTISSDELMASFAKITSSVKISKASTIVKAPKVTNKFKKSKYFKVTVKNKVTKKIVKKVKIKIKVFTGKKYRIYKIKTNSKGIAKFNTKKLTKGKHKVLISSNNDNYKIKAKSKIIIK